MAKARPHGRQEVVDALLASARKLMAERGPGVALRDIADDASVNFGLLYHYFGTKDQLVDVVYRAGAESAAERLQSAEHLEDALDDLMHAGDGTAARLLAWAVLEGNGAAPAFRDSPALTMLADLMRRDAEASGEALSDEDARLFAAFAMTVAVGWRLFAETALLASGFEKPDPAQFTPQIVEWIRALGTSATTTTPTRRAGRATRSDG